LTAAEGQRRQGRAGSGFQDLPVFLEHSRPGVLASWLVTWVFCCWRQGGFFASAQGAPAVFGIAPTLPGPVAAPDLTCGFGWQVQDSNLGRLSSAILQRDGGFTRSTPLTWPGAR
jgi:hypothetical protein